MTEKEDALVFAPYHRVTQLQHNSLPAVIDKTKESR
jgi:hypothetical protein